MKHRIRMMLPCIIALFVFLYSCEEVDSEEVEPSELVTEYTLIYSEISNKTEACAYIRTRGNLFEREEVILNPPSHVSFNDECLEHDSFFVNEYCKEFNGFVDEGVFKFSLATSESSNELLYENIARVQPIEFSNEIPIFRGFGYAFDLNGTSLNVGDKIEIEINEGVITVEISEEDQAVMLTPQQTSEILGNAVEVILRRIVKTDFLDTPSGGSIETIYETAQRITVLN